MLDEESMYFFERAVTGRRYRIAAQSVWDPATGRSVGRQVVLGPADCPPLAQLSETYTVGTRAVGDVGALAWVAEQLDLVTLIDRACGVGGERGVTKTLLEQCVAKALAREHLAEFVMVCIDGEDARPSFSWRVDTRRRRELERTRLGKRVLCTDRHTWGNERIVHGFRGQWHVEELFRRTKKGGIVPWGPSYQWADASLRLHTFATVLGLLLVSLVRLELRTRKSVKLMMSELADIRATLVRTSTGKNGRRPTVLLAPEMTPFQKAAVRRFELARWLPILSSSMTDNAGSTGKSRAA